MSSDRRVALVFRAALASVDDGRPAPRPVTYGYIAAHTALRRRLDG